MNEKFRQTESGWEVYPSKGSKLPGYFQNQLQAERAYQKYMGPVNQARVAREATKKKDK